MGAGSSLANRRPVHSFLLYLVEEGTNRVVRRELLQLHLLVRVSNAQACNIKLLRGDDDPAAFLHVRVMVTRSRCAFCRSLVSSSIADWTLVSASATTVLDSPTARCSSQNAGVVYKLSTHFLKYLIHRSVSCRPNSSPVGQFQTRRAYWPDPEDARASLRSEGRGK